jgi:hypothetical protein
VRLPADYAGRKTLVRLRHPEGKHIASVERNGASWSAFDPAKETVDLPGDPGLQRIRAYY